MSSAFDTCCSNCLVRCYLTVKSHLCFFFKRGGTSVKTSLLIYCVELCQRKSVTQYTKDLVTPVPVTKSSLNRAWSGQMLMHELVWMLAKWVTFKWIANRKIRFVKCIIKYLKCKLHLMRVFIVDHNHTWVLLTDVHLSLFRGSKFFQAALQFTVTFFILGPVRLVYSIYCLWLEEVYLTVCCLSITVTFLASLPEVWAAWLFFWPGTGGDLC